MGVETVCGWQRGRGAFAVRVALQAASLLARGRVVVRVID